MRSHSIDFRNQNRRMQNAQKPSTASRKPKPPRPHAPVPHSSLAQVLKTTAVRNALDAQLVQNFFVLCRNRVVRQVLEKSRVIPDFQVRQTAPARPLHLSSAPIPAKQVELECAPARPPRPLGRNSWLAPETAAWRRCEWKAWPACARCPARLSSCTLARIRPCRSSRRTSIRSCAIGEKIRRDFHPSLLVDRSWIVAPQHRRPSEPRPACSRLLSLGS